VKHSFEAGYFHFVIYFSPFQPAWPPKGGNIRACGRYDTHGGRPESLLFRN